MSETWKDRSEPSSPIVSMLTGKGCVGWWAPGRGNSCLKSTVQVMIQSGFSSATSCDLQSYSSVGFSLRMTDRWNDTTAVHAVLTATGGPMNCQCETEGLLLLRVCPGSSKTRTWAQFTKRRPSLDVWSVRWRPAIQNKTAVMFFRIKVWKPSERLWRAVCWNNVIQMRRSFCIWCVSHNYRSSGVKSSVLNLGFWATPSSKLFLRSSLNRSVKMVLKAVQRTQKPLLFSTADVSTFIHSVEMCVWKHWSHMTLLENRFSGWWTQHRL